MNRKQYVVHFGNEKQTIAFYDDQDIITTRHADYSIVQVIDIFGRKEWFNPKFFSFINCYEEGKEYDKND